MKGQTFFPSHGENCALLLTISSKFLRIYYHVWQKTKKPHRTKTLGNAKYLPTVSPALAHSCPHVQQNGYLIIQT